MIERIKFPFRKRMYRLEKNIASSYRVGEAIILQFQIIKIMFGLKDNRLRQQRNFIHDNIKNDGIQSIENLNDFFYRKLREYRTLLKENSNIQIPHKHVIHIIILYCKTLDTSIKLQYEAIIFRIQNYLYCTLKNCTLCHV